MTYVMMYEFIPCTVSFLFSVLKNWIVRQVDVGCSQLNRLASPIAYKFGLKLGQLQAIYLQKLPLLQGVRFHGLLVKLFCFVFVFVFVFFFFALFVWVFFILFCFFRELLISYFSLYFCFLSACESPAIQCLQ